MTQLMGLNNATNPMVGTHYEGNAAKVDNTPLAQVLLHGIAKIYPRVSPLSQQINGALNQNRRLQQAETFPDFRRNEADSWCSEPVSSFTLPRLADGKSCSFEYMFYDLSNPEVGFEDSTESAITDAFNGQGMGLTFESPDDPGNEQCTYVRVSKDVFATAGHCFPENVTPETFVVMALGFERAGQPCIVAKADVIGTRLVNREGPLQLDSPFRTEDFGLVRLSGTNQTLNTDAYPISELADYVPTVGQKVYMVAHPASLPGSWKATTVTKVDMDNPGINGPNPRFAMDDVMLPGSSGGGVYDADGKLVGLMSFSWRDVETGPDADGNLTLGPAKMWAMSTVGALNNYELVRQVYANQTADTAGEIQSLLPDGMERAEQCIYGFLDGDAMEANLVPTQPVTGNLAQLTDSLNEAGLGETIRNMEATLSSLNTIMSKMEQGEGTMGKLMQDEALYENLANASRELDLLLQDFRLNPKRYVNVSVFGKKQKEYTVPENDPAENQSPQ